MTDQERAVLEAAKAWRTHPSESRLTALAEAVDNMVRNRCAATGIVGDPSWPHAVACQWAAGHEGYHRDPANGIEWRSRR